MIVSKSLEIHPAAEESLRRKWDKKLALRSDQRGPEGRLEFEDGRHGSRFDHSAVDDRSGGLWITRKGAIRARSGDRGVIPGSMGAASFIVSGLGNARSYNSCSHGAGRRMSRGQARREIVLDDFRAEMAGKAWDSDRADKLVDEAPAAYKDIDDVMAAQDDLVAIDHRLHQILNMKGN